MARFSIIIPCYNCDTYLSATLESCLAQTVTDLEVIVVDDGSTDRSANVAAQFEGDRRVRLIRQANAGVGAARNVGLEAASGDFVNFVDADDLLEPDKLQRQGDVLIDNPSIGTVLCDGMMVDELGRVIVQALIDPRRFEGPAPLFEVLFSYGQYPPVVPLIRRSLAIRAGGFSTDRTLAGWADTAFWMDVALLCPEYHLLPDRLCRYRVHQASMSVDRSAMDRAAEGIYAALFRTKPHEAIRAFRRQQARLGDLEFAAAQIQGTLEGVITALEATITNERLQYATDVAAVRAEWERSARQLRVERLETQMRLSVAAWRRSNRPLALWGAGAGGRQALAIVRALGGSVQACIDSDLARSGTYLGDCVPVMTPFEFCRSACRGGFVLIASAYAAEIERQLNAMSLSRFEDYLTLDLESCAILMNQLR